MDRYPFLAFGNGRYVNAARIQDFCVDGDTVHVDLLGAGTVDVTGPEAAALITWLAQADPPPPPDAAPAAKEKARDHHAHAKA